jgi:hypothetical protein
MKHRLTIASLSFSLSLLAAELAPGDAIPAFDSPNRTYAVTAKADYPKASFQAEITVTLKSGQGGNGCAFFGLGTGEGNPKFFLEPTTAPALAFRFAPSDFAGGQVMASLNGETAGEPVSLGDGTHRLRLSWDAARQRAWLEIHPNWKPGAVFASKGLVVIPAAALNFGQAGHLFAGGATGVAFADFSVRPLTEADLKRLPATGDAFPKDPSARTWLPVANASTLPPQEPTTAAADAFLKTLEAHLRPVACWYRGSSLIASRPLPGGSLTLPESSWTLTVDSQKVAGAPEARDLTIKLTLKEGQAPASGLAAALDFTRWDPENYVLIPASVYGGNRNRIEARGYCTGFDAGDFYNPNMTQATTACPQLSPEPGKPSKLEVSACNATTPAICVYDRKARRGLILLAEQGGRNAQGEFLRKANGEILDNAFAVEESLDRSRATIVVGAPGVRELKPEFIGFSGSPDRGLTLQAGDAIVLKLRAYVFAAPDLPAFLDRFMSVRKALTGPNQPRQLYPFSERESRTTQRIDALYWHNGGQFYVAENSTRLCLGWIGGMMNTFPLLVQGDALHRERVLKTFDRVMPAAQGKSGFYLAAINEKGVASGRDWFPTQPIVLTRQDADILYWSLKQFQILKAQGHAADIKPEWENSIRKLAQAFVGTWKKHGQWGNYLNHETGDIAIYHSTSGALAIGGLAMAAQYFNEPEFLKTAQAAGDYYFREDFAKKGFTYGACSDILQNADSETAIALTTSFMTLYETTGKKTWLEKAQGLAHLSATWTVSYDYELPKFTELGRDDAKLAGVVWASTQNKHGAPGFCTNSGDAIFKLYRATGNLLYADLMRDICHAWQEGLRGSDITERLTYCDADSRGSRGWGGSTGWNLLNGALMAQEIPGIYLRTDTERFYVFDAVEAKVVSRTATGVKLEIRNPTKFAAKVAILAENSAQAKKPLGVTALLGWPKISVPAGATATVQIKPDGTVQPL